MAQRFDEAERWRNRDEDRQGWNRDRGADDYGSYGSDRDRYDRNEGGYRSGYGEQGWGDYVRDREGDYGYQGNEQSRNYGMRGSEYRNDTGYTSGDAQYSGVSRYDRGREYGNPGGGSYGDRSHGGYGRGWEQQGNWGNRGESNYGSSNYGGQEYGHRGQDYEGRSGMSGYGNRGGRWRGDNYRENYDSYNDRSSGYPPGGYAREENPGSYYGGRDESDREDYGYGRSGRDNYGNREYMGQQRWREDYGSSDTARHGDNYRRGDRRSAYGVYGGNERRGTRDLDRRY